MTPLNLKMYRVKEVGGDYIVLSSDDDDVKITFAGGSGSVIDNDPPVTKEEHAQFFKHIHGQVGLETPVGPLKKPHALDIFIDHLVDSFGLLRSVPFPFPLSLIEVSSKTTSN
jgi:hypothetical protein